MTWYVIILYFNAVWMYGFNKPIWLDYFSTIERLNTSRYQVEQHLFRTWFEMNFWCLPLPKRSHWPDWIGRRERKKNDDGDIIAIKRQFKITLFAEVMPYFFHPCVSSILSLFPCVCFCFHLLSPSFSLNSKVMFLRGAGEDSFGLKAKNN